MKVKSIEIENYRSIKRAVLTIPESAPLVLFGPNNAGKSNILSAIDRVLGERWPLNIAMDDNDYFERDANKNPCASITASFERPIYYPNPRYGDSPVSDLSLTYWRPGFLGEETRFVGPDGKKLFIAPSDRQRCGSFYIQSNRSASTEFSYSSRSSLLSRFSKKLHEALSSEKKSELTQIYKAIVEEFESLQQYQDFSSSMRNSIEESVKGFVHNLSVDFSAYDPNNYGNTLRISAYEGEEVRSFDELGSGEQQIVIMAFAKAFMEAFGGDETIVLILDEPEAHLHPLAQKWLNHYIDDLCKSGIQVIMSTHSSAFLNIRNLEGLIRVQKKDGKTECIQVSSTDLVKLSEETGVSKGVASKENISDFFASRITNEQLEGMFAEKILLVEGMTEKLALPILLEKDGFLLPSEGVEIVCCNGKNSIPLIWRLYKAFGYKAFCLFDADESNGKKNDQFRDIFNIDSFDMKDSSFICEDEYAYFGKDWESYLLATYQNYSSIIDTLRRDIGTDTSSKPSVAYAFASECDEPPTFISSLRSALEKL